MTGIVKKLLIFGTSFTLTSNGVNLVLANANSKDFYSHTVKYIDNFTEDDFLIAAHRGFSSIEVENSKKALKEANDKDYVDYIEMDVQMTKDHKLILAHDSVLEKKQSQIIIENEKRKDLLEEVFYYNYDALSYLKESICLKKEKNLILERAKEINNKKYKLCSLKNGIKACSDKKILLDLKFSGNIDLFIDQLVKDLEDMDHENIILQSADLPALMRVKERTNFNTLAIISKEKDLKYISLFDNIGIRKNLVDYKLVDSLLKEDKLVAVWTLNSAEEIDSVCDELSDLYKDVIYITDYPDMTATILKDKELVLEKKH